MTAKSLTSFDLELETVGTVLQKLLNVLRFGRDAEVIEVPEFARLMEVEHTFASVVRLFDEVQADVDHTLQKLVCRLARVFRYREDVCRWTKAPD